MILKPRGADAQVATHSHLPRVWREAGMEGRKSKPQAVTRLANNEMTN